MEDATSFQNGLDENLLETALMQHDPDASTMLEWFALVVLALLAIQLCRYLVSTAMDDDVKRLQRTAKEELEILHQTSKDVSAHFFPRSGFLASIFTFKKHNTYPASAPELQPLLHRIRSPQESQDLNRKYHIDRLRVLGSALWFRFQYHGGEFSKEDVSALGQALTKPREPAPSNATTVGLPFMKDTVLWAILPKHREIFSYCLDSLAWALRDENTSTDTVAFPMELLMMMVHEILQEFERKGRQQQEKEEPQVLPDSSNESTTDEPGLLTEPLLPAESNDKVKDMNARTICDHLQLLNVLTASPEQSVRNDDAMNPRIQLPCFKLRPGILETSVAMHSTKHTWIKPFLTKLSLLVDESAKSSSDETLLPPLSISLLRHLPTLMIQLQSYSQATQVVVDQQSFATSRLEKLGLKATVRAYVSEWKSLQHCLANSLLTELTIVKSSVFDLLWTETLSTSADLTRQSTVADLSQNTTECRESTASACLELGSFALDTIPAKEDPDVVTKAVQLFHYGRHLQLLALEAQCRWVAKTLHNLALTLHVVENFPKKNKGGSKKTTRDETSEEATPEQVSESQQCFDLSRQLSKAIDETCQAHKEAVCESTMEYLAVSLCQSLWKAWLTFQRISRHLAEANLVSGRDGIRFRINRVADQFQRARESSQAFADFQSKLPATKATQDLFRAVETLRAITIESDDQKQSIT